ALAALALVIVGAVLGAIFVWLTYWRHAREWMKQQPLLRRSFRPRLAVTAFDDGGADPATIGSGVTALVRQHLYRLARLQEANADYMLDRLTATEDVASAVGELGDLAPQFKAFSALLTVIPQLARLPRYSLGGALQASGQLGGGITMN